MERGDGSTRPRAYRPWPAADGEHTEPQTATGGARRGRRRLSHNVSLQQHLMTWTTVPAGCVDTPSWSRDLRTPTRGSVMDLTLVSIARSIEPKIFLVAQL